MTNPILLISDTHYHGFTQYGQINSKGINSRLADILRATVEAARHLKKLGGNQIIHCGDVFHVRGNINPMVLNHVLDLYKSLINQGFIIHMIAGNHDLETDDANREASTITALENIGVHVIHENRQYKIEGEIWQFMPWIKNIPALRKDLQLHKLALPGDVGVQHNLVLHAPLNGVIDTIPDHGLSPADFEGTIYQRVFVGHYHNHKALSYAGGWAYSVGALTHQTWSCAGNRAGYCIYTPGGTLDQYETQAPKFLKMDFENLDIYADAIISDNYIKVTGGTFTDPAAVQAVKDGLLLRGAKAVVVEGLSRRHAATRTGAISTSAPTLDLILGEYMDRLYGANPQAKTLALGFLKEASDD